MVTYVERTLVFKESFSKLFKCLTEKNVFVTEGKGGHRLKKLFLKKSYTAVILLVL